MKQLSERQLGSELSYLWNRPETDPDFIMSEKINGADGEINPELDRDEVERIVNLYHALCSIYYDVFNNGGWNLPDVNHLQDAVEKITEYAHGKALEVPAFYREHQPECCEPATYEYITADDMDAFARKIIRHLYLDLKP